MPLFRTEALVLRTVDFSESTQIARMFAPDRGKFSAMARGVKNFKSRLGPRLEAFAHVETSVRAKEEASLGTIVSLELLRDWPILRADLERHALAAVLFETLDRGIQENRRAADLFYLTIEYLEMLGEAPDAQSLTVHALLRALSLLGFAPDLREPGPGATAPASDSLFFLPEEGRLSLTPPSDHRLARIRLEAADIEFFRQSAGLNPKQFAFVQAPAAQSRRLLAAAIGLIQHYMETQLKSARFLRKMIWK
jgi:DNA repair protein RecO (recombination protein O)